MLIYYHSCFLSQIWGWIMHSTFLSRSTGSVKTSRLKMFQTTLTTFKHNECKTSGDLFALVWSDQKCKDVSTSVNGVFDDLMCVVAVHWTLWPLLIESQSDRHWQCASPAELSCCTRHEKHLWNHKTCQLSEYRSLCSMCCSVASVILGMPHFWKIWCQYIYIYMQCWE